MVPQLPTLNYTLCFCLHRGDILLLLRAKEPNLNHWNGVGGKIEPGESPAQCATRETCEETGFDPAAAQRRELGVVTWHPAGAAPEGGMHVFQFAFPDSWQRPFDSLDMREGKLQWHPLAFAMDYNNRAIVENIPYFFTAMHNAPELLWYDFGFDAQHRIAEYRVTSAPRAILNT
ncbi:MAG: NUDIX domain-containing protein [Patescibacteria group bacterium]